MNWSIALYLILAATILGHIRTLKQLSSSRDTWVFLILWGLALAAVIADHLELIWLRPLDWIKVIMQPLNKLIP